MYDELIQEDEDRAWRKDGAENGWQLTPVAWPWRAWGIRHIRCAWHECRAYRAAKEYAAAGIGWGGLNQRDVWVLYAIWRGWA